MIHSGDIWSENPTEEKEDSENIQKKEKFQKANRKWPEVTVLHLC